MLHRLYFKKSFLRCDYLTMSTAVLFLSCKIEESHRKLRDVLTVFDYVNKLNSGEQKRPVELISLNSFGYSD
jgi:hypothetical protein